MQHVFYALPESEILHEATKSVNQTLHFYTIKTNSDIY